MAQGEGRVQQEASAALRERTLDRLRSGFSRYVAAEAASRGWDPRDSMIDMSPFIDCARRLGNDPIDVLGPIAATGPAWFQETFDAFVRRSDPTLAAFGWSIVDTPNGQAYRFEWPSPKVACSVQALACCVFVRNRRNSHPGTLMAADPGRARERTRGDRAPGRSHA